MGKLLEHQKVRPTLLARPLRFTRISMGKKRAPAPVQQVMDCSLPERLLPLIVISMARKQVLASPNIQEIQVPPSIEISMGRLLSRARLRAGYQTKGPIILMDGAVQSQKVNNQKKLPHVAQLLEVLKLLPLQDVGLYIVNTQGVALCYELLPFTFPFGR